MLCEYSEFMFSLQLLSILLTFLCALDAIKYGSKFKDDNPPPLIQLISPIILGATFVSIQPLKFKLMRYVQLFI